MRRPRVAIALVALAALWLGVTPGVSAKPRPVLGGTRATLTVAGAVVEEGAKQADVTFELSAPLANAVKVKWSATRPTKSTHQGVVKLDAGTTSVTESLNLQPNAPVDTATAITVTVTSVDAPAGMTVEVPDATAQVVVVDGDAPTIEPIVHMFLDGFGYKLDPLVQFAVASGIDLVTTGAFFGPDDWATTLLASRLAAHGIATGVAYPGGDVMDLSGFETWWINGLAAHQADPANPRISRIATAFDPAMTVNDWPRVRLEVEQLVAARDAAGLDIPIEIGVPATFDAVPGGMAELAALVEHVGIGTLGDTFEALATQAGDEIVAGSTSGLTVGVGLNMAPGPDGDPTTFGDDTIDDAIAAAAHLGTTYRNLIGEFVFPYHDAFRLVTGFPAPMHNEQETDRFMNIAPDRYHDPLVAARVAVAAEMDLVIFPAGTGWMETSYQRRIANELATAGVRGAAGYPGLYMPDSDAYATEWMTSLAAFQADPASPRISRIVTGWGPGTLSDWPERRDELETMIDARDAAGLGTSVAFAVPIDFTDTYPNGMAELAATGVERVVVASLTDAFAAMDAEIGDELAAAKAAGLKVDIGFNLAQGESGDPTTFFDTPVEAMAAVATRLTATYDPAIGGFGFDYAQLFFYGNGVPAP